MRLLAVTVISQMLLVAGPAAAQQGPSFEPYTAYVAPAGGLRVREEPRDGAPVLITLWQGAKVFVRERSSPFARIDGYGVAGFAFVDERFLTMEALTEPPGLPEADAALVPANLR
jgi:hypothetical protein